MKTEQAYSKETDHCGGENSCDVLVIGGGPAGATISALLARRGYRVTTLEKQRHPRFHIGESLLPANLPLFEKLGVADEIRAIGIDKYGAEFVSPWHAHRQTFEFANAWSKSMPSAYQVRRSEFDLILFRHAARQGASMIEGCRVSDVHWLKKDAGAVVSGVCDDGSTRTWRARFVVDASGRDTFLGNRFKTKVKNPRHNTSALYGHFTKAWRHPGAAEGNITIFWFEHGWFWLIPLLDGTTSIGAVVWPHYLQQRKKPLQDFFMDTIALCPALSERLIEAELVSDVHATGNYSYQCERSCGPNYLLLGDAYTFVDPVFSSGVMLAMSSAFAGAELVDTCFKAPQRAVNAMRRFERRMKHGPRQYGWFIYRVTNPAMRDLFMGPRNILRMEEALLSVLAGDIFDKTPIWRSLFAFKAVYYLSCLMHPGRTVTAMRQRRHNIERNAQSRTTQRLG